jgi:hypothetical protein
MAHSQKKSPIHQAARNNAFWCDTVCYAHSGITEIREHLWFNRRRSPPFYPNVVTLTESEGVTAQLEGIHELIAAGIAGDWGVKDSFCTLNLAPLGFHLLFEASWIWRSPGLPKPDGGIADLRWGNVQTPAELARWETAWRGRDGDPQSRIFPPSLLDEPDIIFLAAYRGGPIVAGAIANRTENVVGLSNVFTPPGEEAGFWAGGVTAALETFPGLPLVGYERGDELAIAQSLGFETLEPLKVWIYQP